jgi:hypothetical protein
MYVYSTYVVVNGSIAYSMLLPQTEVLGGVLRTSGSACTRLSELSSWVYLGTYWGLFSRVVARGQFFNRSVGRSVGQSIWSHLCTPTYYLWYMVPLRTGIHHTMATHYRICMANGTAHVRQYQLHTADCWDKLNALHG